MIGQQIHNGSRLVVLSVIGSGLFWLATPQSAPAQGPDPATQLYVSHILTGWRYSHNSKIPLVHVDVVDGDGNPVNGALVVGNCSQTGAKDTTETECTTYNDGTTICVDGRAIVWGKKYTCKKNSKNCPFTFTITKVQKSGMTYVPVQGMTSGSISSLCF
jgi:hypothetical protein